MKELSIEDKAKRYDEAIERAKSKIRNDKNHVLYESDVIEIFPELKVSDDERIRKALLEHIQLCSESIPDRDKWIAWLKKQTEQKSINTDFKAKDCYVSNVDGKIHIIGKFEPKFKVGDWVVNKFGDSWHIDSFDKENYQVSDGKGNHNYFSILHQDEMRLWSIEEAKDGDVLCVNNEVFIYVHKKQMYYIAVAHCFVDSAGGFYLGGEFVYREYGKTICPATKEQRDLLFQKMKEAGYEWNSDKKVVNKVIIYE